jgi:hypothetical protein
MPLFRKKPVVIEAEQWTGDNVDKIHKFSGMRSLGLDVGGDEHFEFRFMTPDDISGTWELPHIYDELHDTWVTVNLNDWIIRGVQGEFYPCRADVFEQTYEAA